MFRELVCFDDTTVVCVLFLGHICKVDGRVEEEITNYELNALAMMPSAKSKSNEQIHHSQCWNFRIVRKVV
jgi:hypothetical protein